MEPCRQACTAQSCSMTQACCAAEQQALMKHMCVGPSSLISPMMQVVLRAEAVVVYLDANYR